MASKDLSNLGKDLKRALDKTLREVVVTIEGELQSDTVSPTDTSRFRSNWMLSEGTPDTSTTEATTPTPKASSLRITSDKEYWLSNNLEYAQAVTIGERVVSKPKTWWKDFRSSRIPKIVKEAVNTVKAEEGL